MPVYNTGGVGLNTLMYASDETQSWTTGVTYTIAKYLYVVHAQGYTPVFDKLLFVVYGANDTSAHNTYIGIYVDSVLKVELTFPYATGGAYTRQFAEMDISDWGADEQYLIELKMKVDAGSTGYQWIWELWMKDLQ